MKDLVEQPHKTRHVLDDQLVTTTRGRKLLDLADEDHQLPWTALRRLSEFKRGRTPLFDRGLVGGAKWLRHEQDVAERPALDRHLARRLDEMPSNVPPMALARPPRRPDRQFGFVPEIMKQAAQRQFLRVTGHAVRAGRAGDRRGPGANLRQTEIQLERRHSALGIELDGATHQHAETGQLVGRFIRGAGRIVPASRKRHPLDDVLIPDLRDVHREAWFLT